MDTKREQVFVGVFVPIAAALLVSSVFAISGVFGGRVKTYRADFLFAGGIEPGATVRYSGGPKVGHVEQLSINPQDASRIEITFNVQSDLPVKTDSRVKIMSSSPLGDNHIEILPGSSGAPLASTGSLLPADDYLDFNALVETLNERSTELKTTVARVNDLLSEQNRSNLSAALANTRGLIEENRSQVQATLRHLNDTSQRLAPVLDNLKKTSEQANKSLDHIDAMVGENRADVRQSVVELRQLLLSVDDLTGRINQTMSVNSENIDELMENLN